MNMDTLPPVEATKPRKVRRQSSDQTMPDLDMPEGVMEALSGDGQLLLTSAEGLIKQLATWLPRRHSTAKWTLLFSTAIDGYSLSTLYRKAVERGPLLVLVRDVAGGLFGAFVAHNLQPPRASSEQAAAFARTGTEGDGMTFHGHGETFLFEVLPMVHLPPLLDGSAPPQISVCAYRWQHSDDLFVSSQAEFLAIGGGGGKYGLRLDADLQHGRSGASATFRNPPLGALPLGANSAKVGAPTESHPSSQLDDSRFFDISTVEIWSVDDWTLHHHVEQTVVA